MGVKARKKSDVAKARTEHDEAKGLEAAGGTLDVVVDHEESDLYALIISDPDGERFQIYVKNADGSTRRGSCCRGTDLDAAKSQADAMMTALAG